MGYGSYGIFVVNTKMFINKTLDKKSWYCSINPAVICALVATSAYGVNFFGTQTEYFSVIWPIAVNERTAFNLLIHGDIGPLYPLSNIHSTSQHHSNIFCKSTGKFSNKPTQKTLHILPVSSLCQIFNVVSPILTSDYRYFT